MRKTSASAGLVRFARIAGGLLLGMTVVGCTQPDLPPGTMPELGGSSGGTDGSGGDGGATSGGSESDHGNGMSAGTDDSGDDGVSEGETGDGPAFSCLPQDLPLVHPLSGSHGDVWVIAGYPDTNETEGVAEDYAGGHLSFDQFSNTAYTVANFRVADEGVPVHAAADGVVALVEDGFADRNVGDFGSCPAPPSNANRVFVRHDNGFATVYSQLKRDSVPVEVGETVVAGQVIGAVGSSGCSTRPGLLFKVADCDVELDAGSIDAAAGVDPFRERMWTAEPQYAPSTRLQDGAWRVGAFIDAEDVVDPGDNTTSVPSGAELGWALYWAHTRAGQSVRLVWRRPDLTPVFELTRELEQAPRWMNWGTATLSTVGVWHVDILLDDALIAAFTVEVT